MHLGLTFTLSGLIHAIGAFIESDNQEALSTLFFFASNAAIIIIEDALQHLCTKLGPDSRRKYTTPYTTQPPSVFKLILQYGWVLSWLTLVGPLWDYRMLRVHWTKLWPAVSAPVSQHAVVPIAAKGCFVLISGLFMKVIFRISL